MDKTREEARPALDITITTLVDFSVNISLSFVVHHARSGGAEEVRTSYSHVCQAARSDGWCFWSICEAELSIWHCCCSGARRSMAMSGSTHRSSST